MDVDASSTMDPIAAHGASHAAPLAAQGANGVHPGAATREGRARPHEDATSASAAKRPSDSVALSPEGLAQAEASTGAQQLSDAEKKQVQELRARDREVRAHEQAHKAAGGDLASAPSYETQRGPDGNHYAVGGEVGIELREGDTPEETVEIARRVRSAALAPAQPSTQDMSVAAQASQMESRARAEAAEEKRAQEGDDPSAPAGEVRPGEAQPGAESPGEARAAERSTNSAAGPLARAAQTYAEIGRLGGPGDGASTAEAATSLPELFG